MNDEIQALRRMAQVLARVATPLERQNIARRVAQLDAGEVETIPAEQVLAELRARLK